MQSTKDLVIAMSEYAGLVQQTSQKSQLKMLQSISTSGH